MTGSVGVAAEGCCAKVRSGQITSGFFVSIMKCYSRDVTGAKSVGCLLCFNASQHARFVVKLHFKDLFPNNKGHAEANLGQHLDLFYKKGQSVDFIEDFQLLLH
jgi:hypothetical protein